MIAVIFEVWPNPDHQQDYLSEAAKLREHLKEIDGFISIERFASLAEDGKLVSISFWRDEDSLAAWRNLEAHRLAQEKGRDGYFLDYRLRVAEVSRDYAMSERDEAPADSRLRHDSAI